MGNIGRGEKISIGESFVFPFSHREKMSFIKERKTTSFKRRFMLVQNTRIYNNNITHV